MKITNAIEEFNKINNNLFYIFEVRKDVQRN